MKNITLVFLSLLLAFSTAGCYYGREKLKRTPAKQSVKKVPKKRNKDADQDDGVFRSIFNRNPQNFDKSSMLSAKERELIRNYDVSKDPAAGQIHKDGRKSDTRNKDWVFGTENGSYF